ARMRWSRDLRGDQRRQIRGEGKGIGERSVIAVPSGSLSVTTTDALFAGEVQRKVSNGVAGLAAAGSSLDRPAIAANPASQRSSNIHASTPADILARGRS